MRRIAFLPGLLILWLCAACGSCDRAGSGPPAPSFGPTEGVPTVRVALRTDAESVRMAIEGPYTITNGETGKLISQGSSLPASEVVFRDPFFVIEPSRMNTKHLVLTPANDGTLVVGDGHYRGTLHLLCREGKIAAVNHVNLEHYLASVIPSEMKITWPEPALKAQAVAARTYALWRMEQAQKRKLAWDLTSGSDSQVYGGLDKESRTSRKVVVDTAGTVLTYEGKIFPTYYHSTCGGFTADAHIVFGGMEMPCLMGVPCGHCSDSPVYRWSLTLDQEELQKIIKEDGGKDTGPIVDIERLEPDAGERTKVVVFKGEKGSHEMRTSVLRKLVGTARMKSVAFRVKKTGSSFEILGSGWGHGVGMCQWGAAGMGNPTYRYTAQEILQHYYQETKLLRIY